MLHILHQIAKTGIRSEPAPTADEDMVVVARLHRAILRTLGRALTIRHVDAGSCNGCELEIQALANPYYNLEGMGIRFVASPRHADMLLVTGPVTSRMSAWRGEATMSRPKRGRSYSGLAAAPSSCSHPLHEPAST